ncbi:MAG: glycosyltransferase [Coriobacteriales bacterium]
MAVKISFVAEQLASCAWYRCQVPGRALAAAGYDVHVADWIDLDRLAASDVVVFQRPSEPHVANIVRDLVAMGKTVVIDMDDDLWNLHPANPVYAVWKEPETIGALEECIRSATTATAATPELARLMSRLNPLTVVVPNMLRREDWPAEMPDKDTGERIVIGWAGSTSHAPDLPQLAGVVDTILARREDVEVWFAGYHPGFVRPHPRLRLLPPVSLEEYPALVAKFDVGLAPLVDISFNRCKSDLKFLEYAAAGAATVASDVAAYHRAVRHGETGMLVKSPKDWLTYLQVLLDKPALRASIREQAHAYVQTRFAEENVRLYQEAYGLV